MEPLVEKTATTAAMGGGAVGTVFGMALATMSRSALG
jgi:3-dehydroquinate synthetase